jgi:hypothetical protein
VTEASPSQAESFFAPAPGPGFPMLAPLPQPLPLPLPQPQPRPQERPSTYATTRPEVSAILPADAPFDAPAEAPAESYAGIRPELAPLPEPLPMGEAPAGSAPAVLPEAEEHADAQPVRKLLQDAAPIVTDWITSPHVGSQATVDEAADLPAPPPPPPPPPPGAPDAIHEGDAVKATTEAAGPVPLAALMTAAGVDVPTPGATALFIVHYHECRFPSVCQGIALWQCCLNAQNLRRKLNCASQVLKESVWIWHTGLRRPEATETV